MHHAVSVDRDQTGTIDYYDNEDLEDLNQDRSKKKININPSRHATNPSLNFYEKEEKTGTTVWTDADRWAVGLH